MQITRYGERAVRPAPDTLTVYLIASQLRGNTVVRDSAPVTLTFAPVGQVPPTISASFQLPSP